MIGLRVVLARGFTRITGWTVSVSYTKASTRQVETIILALSRALSHKMLRRAIQSYLGFTRTTAATHISRLIRGILIMRTKVASITNVGNDWLVPWSTFGGR